MEKIKVGIIGVGGIAQTHIAAYRNNPNVELYAFCDIDPVRLEQQGKEHGIERLYTDVNDMMAALPELDAVSVCTWNCAHAACTIAALNAGKNVLCEKPMAMNAEEATQMMEAAEKSGKLLMIGFVRRFGNDMKILKEFIDTDYFGELYYSKVTYMRRNGNPGGWFGDKARSGGGPLIDLGVHVIDFARYAMGNPKPVSVYAATYNKLGNRSDVKTGAGYKSVGATDNDTCDVEDLAVALIRFDNGATLNLETSFSINMKESDRGTMEFYGTKGGAKINPELELTSVQNGYMVNTSIAAKTALSFDGLFQNEINHYIDCVMGKCECIAPAEDGYQLMRILTAAYKSAETGHEVVL
ncbi:MAG: Gfo/Idh/MocA family oxidoreductase [Ruminococcaceae bacterium]|nr:Gfo/Idh/MocA family oxidoreductase [Oscillospiraceae bacterium]